MLKPVHFVAAARLALLVGSLTVAVLTLGPFQGAERMFGLNDKAAHAIAFGGLLAISFLAFPRMRRNDLAIAAPRTSAAVEVSATATCAGKTGVEMEALTAAAVSGLTIYDMCKAVSKDIVIERVRLESKIGGKSGEWRRSTRPRM